MKNRFDPALRHGFQSYSTMSQYNLLAASFMSAAWLFADDDIPERACPAESGGFAFSLPQFHKIFANAGGLYVELDTAPDPEYDSAGLIRIHKTGVDSLIGPSAGGAIVDGPVAIGIAWREEDNWQSLAALRHGQVESEFALQKAEPNDVRFSVRYVLNRPAVKAVVETYRVTPEQVEVNSEIEGNVSKLRVQFPALAFDGEEAFPIEIHDATATVRMNDSREDFTVESPARVILSKSEAWISSRNGFLQTIAGEISGKRVTYAIKPFAAPIRHAAEIQK